MLRIGIIGLVVSIVAIVIAFIVVLGTDLAVEPLSSIVCTEPDFLIRETFQTAPGQTEVRFYCTNHDETVYDDVTGFVIVVLFAAFVPLVIFIFLIVRGATRKIKSPNLAIGDGIQLDHSSDRPLISGIPSTSNNDVIQFPGQGLRRVSQSMDQKVRKQLDELKRLHDLGKISYGEYDRVRKNLMKELTK